MFYLGQAIFTERSFHFQDMYFVDGCQWQQDYQRTHMIIYVKEGCMRMGVNGERFCAYAGDILFVPSEASNLDFDYHGRPYRGLNLRFRFFPNVDYYDYPTQVIPANPELSRFAEAIPIDTPLSTEKIWKFYRFLASLQSKLKQANQKHLQIIETAIAYMNANNDYDIATLARVCKVSESGFRAIFRAVTGHTMIEEKHRIQAYKAEKLLRSTDLSIDEIARQVGFASTQHFRKIFKKRYSTTPDRLRRTPDRLVAQIAAPPKDSKTP